MKAGHTGCTSPPDLEDLRDKLHSFNAGLQETSQGHKGVRRGPIRLLLALLALSVSAIALGFLLRGVDFYPAHQTGRVRVKMKGLNGTTLVHRTGLLGSQQCRALEATYRPLVDSMLEAFQGGLTVEYIRGLTLAPGAKLYIQRGQLYVDGSLSDLSHPMTVLFADYIHQLMPQARLPDMVMALNPDDFPHASGDPWFSFCRRPRVFNDLLLPNTLEDGLFNTRDWSAEKVRAGRGDIRRPMAVWLGRPMAWKRGKRKAILEEGFRNPHRVYSGLTRWDGIPIPDKNTEQEWRQFLKPHLELADWEAEFKYIVNVEGNCGSARLARQLMGDAVVFLVAGEDQEWYYPLLVPYMHYIPVTVKPDGTTNLLAQIEWAERRPDKVLAIVKASNAFAKQHLAPGSGRECYSAQLLLRYSRLFNSTEVAEMGLPASVPPYRG